MLGGSGIFWRVGKVFEEQAAHYQREWIIGALRPAGPQAGGNEIRGAGERYRTFKDRKTEEKQEGLCEDSERF